jgi:hypothetical protein
MTPIRITPYYWSEQMRQFREWERAAMQERMAFARIMVEAIYKQARGPR